MYIYPGTSLGNANSVVDISKISILIVTNSLLIGNATLTEEQINQLRSVHPGIFIGISQ